MLRFIRISAVQKAGIRMKGVKMGNNGRNVRLSKQQIERRRKKRIQKRIFYLSITVILCILLYCIWNIDVRLKEIQATLKHFEARRYGVSDTGSYGTGEKEDKDEEIDYADYVGSIDSMDVSKPVRSTEEEVLKQIGRAHV